MDNIKQINIHMIGVPEREDKKKKKKGHKTCLKK